MTATLKATNQTLSLNMLIQTILEEANNKAAKKNVDDAQENAAMVSGQKEKKGCGGKSKSKWNKSDLKCRNCNFTDIQQMFCFWRRKRKEGSRLIEEEVWKEQEGKLERKIPSSKCC